MIVEMYRLQFTVSVIALCLVAAACGGSDDASSGPASSVGTASVVTTQATTTSIAPTTTTTTTTTSPPTTASPTTTIAAQTGVQDAEWISAIAASYKCVLQPPGRGSDPSIAQITACDLPTGGMLALFEVTDAVAFMQWSAEVAGVARGNGYWMVSPTLAVVSTNPNPQMVSDFRTLDIASGV